MHDALFITGLPGVSHYGPVTGVDFFKANQSGSEFSHLFLTSSTDWTVKLWTFRNARCVYADGCTCVTRVTSISMCDLSNLVTVFVTCGISMCVCELCNLDTIFVTHMYHCLAGATYAPPWANGAVDRCIRLTMRPTTCTMCVGRRSTLPSSPVSTVCV